jgi:hypothetical protein
LPDDLRFQILRGWEKRPDADESKERKLISWKNARPHPAFSPRRRDRQSLSFDFMEIIWQIQPQVFR